MQNPNYEIHLSEGLIAFPEFATTLSASTRNSPDTGFWINLFIFFTQKNGESSLNLTSSVLRAALPVHNNHQNVPYTFDASELEWVPEHEAGQ